MADLQFEALYCIQSTVKSIKTQQNSLQKTVGKSVTDSGYAYVTQWFWFRTSAWKKINLMALIRTPTISTTTFVRMMEKFLVAMREDNENTALMFWSGHSSFIYIWREHCSTMFDDKVESQIYKYIVLCGCPSNFVQGRSWGQIRVQMKLSLRFISCYTCSTVTLTQKKQQQIKVENRLKQHQHSFYPMNMFFMRTVCQLHMRCKGFLNHNTNILLRKSR